MIDGGPSDFAVGDSFVTGTGDAEGGGRDKLFGQAGADDLFGGPKRDLCNGGGGAADTATDCEDVVNVP